MPPCFLKKKWVLFHEYVFVPIIDFLRAQGHRVISVREEGLSGISDDEIYRRAVAENLIILTMDKDFTRTLRFPAENCGGIVVIKLYRRTVEETTSLFIKHFNTLSAELIARRLVIIIPEKVRIRPALA